MYDIVCENIDYLKKCEGLDTHNTVFTTYSWIDFLRVNQKAEPVILKVISDKTTVAVFVGLLIRKFGMKILGSPFEGWLTCDMGFIHLGEFNINTALKSVAEYAFKKLGCLYIQITDKRIKETELDKSIKYYMSKIVHLDISLDQESVLASFTKNGRRDVRAAERKLTTVKRVEFNRDFMDMYFTQLEDVFDKQGLKPFYSKEKLYQIVDAFKYDMKKTLALEVLDDANTCIATAFSLAHNDWAYYLGASSLREYQKLLPNEKAFWQFVKYWHEAGITRIDMVGIRSYKMKYSPELIDVPVVFFERIPGIKKIKDEAKHIVEKIRDLKTNAKKNIGENE